MCGERLETSSEDFDVLSWYDELSSGYDELYGEEQRRKFLQVVKEVSSINHVGGGNPVILDLGCGTGGLAGLLLDEFSGMGPLYYVGLDLSPSMCFLSRERVGNAGLLGDVVAGDIFRPPFRGRVANAVFSITALTCGNFVEGMVQALENLVREGGLLIYTILCSDLSKIPESGLRVCDAIAYLSEREVLCVVKPLPTPASKVSFDGLELREG